MALKLFCNKCQEVIKEITPDEAKHLSETVICENCKQVAYEFKDQLVKEYDRLNKQLANTYNKAIVKLEETIRQALQ